MSIHKFELGCMNRAGTKKGRGAEAGLEMQVKDWAQIADYLRGVAL